MLRKNRLTAPTLCTFFAVVLSISASAQSVTVSAATGQQGESGKPAPPNILFIIMDDVGIDQMQIFGYGGVTPPLTPNINAIARAGVRFRNVWAMPECSPSRAIFFEGRYPLRTNVFSAILSDDLANSQVSPFEVTTPQILRTKKYTSGLFGKFHLAGPDNNEFTNMTPHALGWDYFDGFLEVRRIQSIPPSVDNPTRLIPWVIPSILADLFPIKPTIPPTAPISEHACSRVEPVQN